MTAPVVGVVSARPRCCKAIAVGKFQPTLRVLLGVQERCTALFPAALQRHPRVEVCVEVQLPWSTGQVDMNENVCYHGQLVCEEDFVHPSCRTSLAPSR